MNHSPVFALAINNPQKYSSILNSLQRIVENTALRIHGKITVMVGVRKLDNTYCKVYCQLVSKDGFSNIPWGDSFSFNGKDIVKFETMLATGFTTPEDVKREILIQFAWASIEKSNTDMSLSSGDESTPTYVAYKFTIEAIERRVQMISPNIEPNRLEGVQLGERIATIIPYLEEALPLAEKVAKDEEWIEAVKSGRIKNDYMGRYSVFFVPGLAFCTLGFWVFVRAIISRSGSRIALLIIVAMLLFGIGAAHFVFGKYVTKWWLNRSNESLNKLLSEKEKSVEIDRNHLNELLYSNPVVMETLSEIPEQYMDPIVLRKMSEYLYNRRADSIKEAINLFEEECHRMEMEAIARQQAAQLNAIRRASSVSAGANVATMINSFRRK